MEETSRAAQTQETEGTEKLEKSPKTTPLHEKHLSLGARMAEFAGFDMPIYYPSPTNRPIQDEVQAVRQRAGLFDIGHMGEIIVHGKNSFQYLEKMLTSHIGRIKTYQMAYALLCNENGGVIDDLYAYRF